MHALFKDSLANKVALVTGAGSGIGKATAKLFAYAGARVGALTRSADEAEETCREIRRGHGEALGLTADVSDAAAVARSYRTIEDAWGRLDIVVANAGVNGLWAPVDEIDEANWDQTLDINLKGTFLTVKHAVPLLKRQGGAIVIVASVNGTRIFSNAGASAYATSKAGQLAFARMMALELAKHRIRVNTVCPGSIETNIDQNTERKDLEKVREPVVFPEGRTPGLLDAHDFFDHLARRIFPCTDYIRAREEMDYTPAPDCFHDIFGHTPMIMHPRFADFYQRIGQAALRCRDAQIEEGLTRIYWFTVEFGLVKNPGGLRIFGNGILSSYGETQHSLTDKVTRRPFDPDVVAATPYDIWHFQDVLFVVESFDQLADSFDTWVARHIT